jgi:S-adenosylmethionine-diacylglycerol 3-amino-3-carboxypropyl transferase
MTAVSPKSTTAPATRAIEHRARFDHIRYANCWEDAAVLCDALRPVAAGQRLLSVASAGDNALALLTLDPSSVTAVDLSQAQLACVELRVAAFRVLDHDQLLAFLGIRPHSDRLRVYAGLRSALSPAPQEFWDTHQGDVRRGIVHGGKFEAYFRLFRRLVLPFAVSARNRRRLLAARDVAEQRRVYADLDTRRWRALFRLFFSRAVMGRLGRDPEFFREVAGPVAARIFERTRYAMSELPASTNPFLVWILTGSFSDDALPVYLRPEHFHVIRERLDRLRILQGRVEQTTDGPYGGFNLSDVFEYMTPSEHERVYADLVRQANPGARLVYWNLLAPRGIPGALSEQVQPLSAEAGALHQRDRAWFYSRLHVDRVNGP